MTGPSAGEDEFIWATRGRAWGFRFLRRGGLERPLRVYEELFTGLDGNADVWRKVGSRAAVRFPDPEGRTDASGRLIPHDFVVLGALAKSLESFESARAHLWQIVADEYGRAWDRTEPPGSIP